MSTRAACTKGESNETALRPHCRRSSARRCLRHRWTRSGVRPLTGLKAICLEEGGTFQPGAPVGTALCTNTGLVVYSQIAGSYESSGLVAIDRLCKAAGFGGVHPFGKGPTDGGFAVAGWGCFAAP
jgi:hypothetical protein